MSHDYSQANHWQDEWNDHQWPKPIKFPPFRLEKAPAFPQAHGCPTSEKKQKGEEWLLAGLTSSNTNSEFNIIPLFGSKSKYR